MKTTTKIMIGIALIGLFIIPISTQFVAGKNDKIQVKEGAEAIEINTEYITMKIISTKPHFIWWNGNRSTADEMYNVQYTTLQEFFGEDEILDNSSELNGITYNLLTSDWDYSIIEEEDALTVTLTLSGLANDVEIQFIIHIYNEDQFIEETGQTIKALKEVKFDIIVKNWVFNDGAQGLALKTQILESQKRHQVRIRNGTNEELGNRTRRMTFESEDHGNAIVAYYDWATIADVYDGSEKISTIEVGTSYLVEGDKPGVGPGVEDPGMVQQWLTYPKYGDSLTLVHDPSIGVIPENFSIPLYTLPIIGGLIATALILGVKRKRN